MSSKFIELYKKIEYRIHLSYLIIITFLVGATFYIVSLNFNVLLKNEVDIKYKSYSNVIVEIDRSKIKGRLNKYLTTKHFNDNCYLPNCGLPKTGNYSLKEIKFISINEKWFLLQTCIEEKSVCFKNLPDSFMDEYKEKLLSEVKNDIVTGFLMIFWIVLVGLYKTKKYRKILSREI